MMKRSRGPLIVSLCSLAGVFALVVAAGLLARMSVGWTATELTVVTGVNGVHSGFFDLVAHAINVAWGRPARSSSLRSRWRLPQP